MIVDFYNNVCKRADVLICQCENGESRSAAVVAAILEYRCRKGISIFSDERYFPNKSVYKKLLKSFSGVSKMYNKRINS